MPHSSAVFSVCEWSGVVMFWSVFSSSSTHPSLTGSCLESQLAESPAIQVDGSDLASPISPRASKSRMSMKLRRSSGSANKTWPEWANTHTSLRNSAHCTVRDKPRPVVCSSHAPQCCLTPPIQSQSDQRWLKCLFLSIADGYSIAFYLKNFLCCYRG